MHIEREPEGVRAASRAWRRSGECVGFVPTMGALHAGHLALVDRARAEGATRVIVSIFVNPTQFGPHEDLAAYPRDLEGDSDKLRAIGVDLVFFPSVAAIYPDGAETFVTLDRLPEHLCGLSRPGHFRGVATVVTVLFNLVEPDIAVFGEKDFQQLRVIQKLVRDLHLPVRIVGAPTHREADGLARSSRNAYLSASERQSALCLSAALRQAQARVTDGDRDAATLIAEMITLCTDAGGRVDYVAVVDEDSLDAIACIDRPVRAILAVFIGRARLIDNARLVPRGGPETLDTPGTRP